MTLLSVSDLNVSFETSDATISAVCNASFDIAAGECLGIVGESGSGKSTAALAIARLVEANSGSVLLGNDDFLLLQDEALRQARAQVQFIFQDPYASLNPRLRAEAVVREPLDSLGKGDPGERQASVDALFKAVGLRPEQQRLFPHQFSGGQRQRIGVARALATRPELIICDEPVSALDVAVQAQILNLLRKLQKDFDLTYLFISHDLGVVQHMCDSVAVMYMGKIVEHADRLNLFNNPLHPYTKALLSAVPSVDKKRREETKRILIPGDPPDPLSPPKGCRFANRCPAAQEQCSLSQPPLRQIAKGHTVACHLVSDDGVAP